ncbi:MAG: dTDP-4-dehydrorhamnose reductase [Solirubrobacterales bacterium]|nr:MAG: dTDP-4-dehydrorhamnose reductase [Solirubrobacterales bacterium]
MLVMITGAGGMLGQDVCASARDAGHDVIALARAELDITDAQAVGAAVRSADPDAVVNCAAFTDVDGSERESDRAHAVNEAGAGNVARAAATAGAWTVHVSSDYVFDGLGTEPYVESDAPRPLSAYGASKLAGERAVAAGAPDRHTIVRSSWLFGAGGSCFPATILRLAAEREQLTVVDDQIGCPTFTGHLAPALVALATERRVAGLLHVTGAGRCSWYELARELVASAGLGCELRPGTTAELGRPAPRPPYSVLGTERDAPRLPAWREGLAQFMGARAPAR